MFDEEDDAEFGEAKSTHLRMTTKGASSLLDVDLDQDNNRSEQDTFAKFNSLPRLTCTDLRRKTMDSHELSGFGSVNGDVNPTIVIEGVTETEDEELRVENQRFESIPDRKSEANFQRLLFGNACADNTVRNLKKKLKDTQGSGDNSLNAKRLRFESRSFTIRSESTVRKHKLGLQEDYNSLAVFAFFVSDADIVNQKFQTGLSKTE